MKVNPELQKALSEAKAELIRHSNHLVYRIPGTSQLLIIGCSPSDYRANQNNLSRLRRLVRESKGGQQ